jgi:hypothetical protein
VATGTLQTLERVVEEPPERPERPPSEYEPLQHVTRLIALEGGWSDELAARIRQLFDALAPEWHTRGGEVRVAPTIDALARGGIAPRGTCVEVGSGTGIHTPPLSGHFDRVLSVDLSAEMLQLAPRDLSVLLQADASQLPFKDGSVDAVVCVNAFLFPAEYDRVLAAAGSIAFVSTAGDQTPIFLAPEDVLSALPGRWSGLASHAAWGTWMVARRDEEVS